MTCYYSLIKIHRIIKTIGYLFDIRYLIFIKYTTNPKKNVNDDENRRRYKKNHIENIIRDIKSYNKKQM
jgi:hypothetical protein